MQWLIHHINNETLILTAENMNSKISYTHWKSEYESILEEFPQKKVFLLFSGGKDSSLAMDLLLRAEEEFGFCFESHAAAYPVHRYTEAEREKIISYWHKRGVNITWHELKETDAYINNAPNPCLPCQNLRRKTLKTLVSESAGDLKNFVIIANYSLWDIVSYSMEHILTDIFSDIERKEGVEEDGRFIQTAQRFYPVLKMKEGYTVFRPLIKYNSNDIAELISQKGIPILSIPCKYSDYRPKRILEKYYNKMGLRFDYDRVFEFAKKSLNLPDISSYSSINKDEYLRKVF